MDFFIPTCILVAFISLFGYLYVLIKKRFEFWKKLNVPYLEPPSYIFGQNQKVVTGELSMAENHNDIYKKLAPHKYGGIYDFFNPVFIPRDPELIKHILTKDFNNFYDRSFYFAKHYEPLTMHLFNLTGEEWKTIRAKLTPTFSSGKLKLMFSYVKECAEELIKVIDESKHDDLEMKNLMARYTTDVISSCAFGLNADSLRNPNSEFKKMGMQALTPTPLTRIKDILQAIAPKLIFFFRIRTFDSQVTKFFNDIVRDAVKYREENNIVRNDFLHLVKQLRHDSEESDGKKNSDAIKLGEKSVGLTLELVTAQCFVIFLGGFETSSSALSFTLFELARNTHVQKKLQNEIDEILQKHDGQFTYESIQEMTYADMVISETLRKYPAIPLLLRTCTQDYQLPDSDLVIKRGMWVFVPIYGLHHDPAYYSYPDDFYPEHFTEEAIQSRPHFTYLPFGDGPRVCIGLRFGLMQVKLALAMLLRNYTFTLSPKMELPLKFVKHSVLTNSEGGIWLNCTKRNVDTREE